MNIRYLVLRIARHFMPEGIARFLLKKRLIIRPGLESSDPLAAVTQYVSTLTRFNRSIVGKRVLVFGYGGRFAVGVELLRQGASHVVLCDHFVLIDRERNLELLSQYSDFLFMDDNEVKPRPEYITLLHGDICDPAIQKQVSQVDVVLSTSVFEHLDGVDAITRALAAITSPSGAQLHYVDLRDHYFKYPFEMLAYSTWAWKNLLNPTSNLNRFRLWDYRRIFETYFNKIDILITGSQEMEFEASRQRIRSEYISGNLAEDAATLICVYVDSPKR